MQQNHAMQYAGTPETADIRVKQIYEEFHPADNSEDPPVSIMMCDYMPTGSDGLTLITRPVNEMLDLDQGLVEDSDNSMMNMAKARANAIQAETSAIHNNSITPAGHTPFEAWSGLTSTQAMALRKCSVRSLEELASASESTLAKVSSSLQNPKKLRDMAAACLSSKSSTAAAAQLVKAKEDNDALRIRLIRMEEMLTSMAAERDVEKKDAGPSLPTDDLTSEAESLGIKVDGRWSDKRLQEEIDNVLTAPALPVNNQVLETAA